MEFTQIPPERKEIKRSKTPDQGRAKFMRSVPGVGTVADVSFP
jgi:hypothetical protein